MKKFFSPIALVFGLALLACPFQACDDDDNNDDNSAVMNLKVESVDLGDCKEEMPKSASLDDMKEIIIITPSKNAGEITIEHLYVYLACGCNVKVTATLDAKKRIITLNEEEEGPLADCLCCRDISTVISGVEKGEYTLVLSRRDFSIKIRISDDNTPTTYLVC